jgi:hypothetical protein
VTANELLAVLKTFRFRYDDEMRLQEGIAAVLASSHIPFEREVKLSQHDRIDFMTGRLGIEVKVGHPLTSVMKQVHRYMQIGEQENPVNVYFMVSDEGSDPFMVEVNGVKEQQIEGIRDPEAALVEKLQLDPDRIKNLARRYLERHSAKSIEGTPLFDSAVLEGEP